MRLHEGMQTLEVLVEFHAHFNKTHLNNSWCDDIELFIDYDTESESLRGTSLVFFQGTRAMHFDGYFKYFRQSFLGRSSIPLPPSEKILSFSNVHCSWIIICISSAPSSMHYIIQY